MMLTLQNISVKCENKILLDKLNLQFVAGSTSLILGPNGSGKSSLAKTIMGYPGYDIIQGSIQINPQFFHSHSSQNFDLLSYSLSERAKLGIFLSFQQPVDLGGIAPVNYLKTIFNAHRRYQNLNELSSGEFLDYLRFQIQDFDMDPRIMTREYLASMSGGEKKNFELLQLILLKPKLIILDEIDAGLDVDGLSRLAKIIHKLSTPEIAWIIISHNPTFTDLLNINRVHVLSKGVLVDSGQLDLAHKIKNTGFSAYV